MTQTKQIVMSSLLTFLILIPGWSPSSAQETIDWEGLPAGTYLCGNTPSPGPCVTIQSAAGDPILIDGFDPFHGPDVNAAMIFDTNDPTGGDDDLGSPNETCDNPGPGVGAGGEKGQPFENCPLDVGDPPLDNVMIVSEDLDPTDPDDSKRPGTQITMDFSQLQGVVTLFSIAILDLEQTATSVQVFDASNTLIFDFTPLPQTGDNGLVVVEFNGPDGISGVARMVVLLNGSGSLDTTVFLQEPTSSLGDRVWHDLNANGIQDGGEVGIEGVVVNLLDPGADGVCNTGDEVIIASDVTDDSGLYGFTDLQAGDYCVGFVNPNPAVWMFSPPNAGADDVDSDADPATGQTIQTITLPAGVNDPTWDAGLFQKASLGDFVWEDLNGNGIQDPGEPGVPGVTVALLDCNGVVLGTTTTDGSGLYLFTDLRPGCYEVRFVRPAGATFTLPNVGGDDTVDSDADPTTGRTGPIDLESGETDLTWDAGLVFEICELAVDKTCQTLIPPSLDFICSDAKPIDCLAMIWDGPDNVTITAWKGDVGSTELTDINVSGNGDGDIDNGEQVTVCGMDGSPNDQQWEIFAAATGTPLGISEFHISCSDDDMNGPEDCGNEAGNGKSDESGLANDWLFEGMVGTNGMTLNCTEDISEPGLSECSAPFSGAEVIYSYEITNVGITNVTDITVVDDPEPGDPFTVPGSPIAFLGVGQTETLQATVFIDEATSNVATATGITAGGATCSASDSAVVNVAEEPCAECKGGTTDIVFEYQGGASVQVVIYDDKDPKANEILFDGPVMPGDLIPITKRPGQSKLDKDISLWIDGVLDVKVHTSCSKPIGPGLEVGQFEIVEARSKDAGLMCPLIICDVDGSAGLEFSGKEVKWPVSNNGDVDLVIERITISWPAANGDLDEVKRDGDSIHKGDFPPPSAVIDSGWEGDEDKRIVKTGETDTMKFKFKNDVTADGDYTITIEFDQDCVVTVEYTPPFIGGDFVCSKPIDELTMIWDGGGAVDVEAWKGEVGSTSLGTVSGVTDGSEVSFSGFAGSPNDVIWEIFDNASGTKVGESTFHLSCSDDDMDGPEDCGKREGDGKDKSGFLNEWLLEGMVDSDETLDCNP